LTGWRERESPREKNQMQGGKQHLDGGFGATTDTVTTGLSGKNQRRARKGEGEMVTGEE